jgi:hypothetical protein
MLTTESLEEKFRTKVAKEIIISFSQNKSRWAIFPKS